MDCSKFYMAHDVMLLLTTEANASDITTYYMCTYILCLNQLPVYQLTGRMINYLLLLPWYTTITGYQISSSNNNNQEKSTIGYGQTSKSLLEQVGQQE